LHLVTFVAVEIEEADEGADFFVVIVDAVIEADMWSLSAVDLGLWEGENSAVQFGEDDYEGEIKFTSSISLRGIESICSVEQVIWDELKDYSAYLRNRYDYKKLLGGQKEF